MILLYAWVLFKLCQLFWEGLFSTQKEVRLFAKSIRFTYNLITKKGRALDILFSRLLKAMDLDQIVWGEEDTLKKVGRTSDTQLLSLER